VQFEYPYIFALLIFFILCHKWCPLRSNAIYFPHLAHFTTNLTPHNWWLFFLKWATIIALITALASPFSKLDKNMTPKEGIDIALLIDASASMDAKGFVPGNRTISRFDVVKEIVKTFATDRQDDNIGVVVFGSYAFSAAPLTYDKSIIVQIIDNLYIAMAGRQTALYDALAQSANLFINAKAKEKVAILLTDGINTAGRMPLEATLKILDKLGVKVYTVAIGRNGEFDEYTLKHIANETHGKFFKARTSDQLQTIYETIDKLETSAIETHNIALKKHYFQYFLFFGFITLLLYVTIKNAKVE
jgi:Ca-activated chloride channel family protein